MQLSRTAISAQLVHLILRADNLAAQFVVEEQQAHQIVRPVPAWVHSALGVFLLDLVFASLVILSQTLHKPLKPPLRTTIAYHFLSPLVQPALTVMTSQINACQTPTVLRRHSAVELVPQTVIST